MQQQSDNLTGKQRKFINEWLLCRNITEAAKKAGYSEKIAYSIGHENLKKPEIQRYVEQKIREEEQVVGISRITQLAKLKQVQDEAIESGDFSAVIGATKEINKMMGWYKKPEPEEKYDDPFAKMLHEVFTKHTLPT